MIVQRAREKRHEWFIMTEVLCSFHLQTSPVHIDVPCFRIHLRECYTINEMCRLENHCDYDREGETAKRFSKIWRIYQMSRHLLCQEECGDDS